MEASQILIQKKKKYHRHEWQPLIPRVSEITPELRTDYWVETITNSVLRRSVQCVSCGTTGYRIASRRGGIRVHRSDLFLKDATVLAEKYSFELPFTTLLPI